MIDAGHLATLIGTALTASGDGHDAHWNYTELAGQFVNFFIFFGFLAVVLKKPIQIALETRRAQMEVKLKEAQEKTALAEQRLAEYAAKLQNLEAEVQRVVASFEAQGKTDRERIQQDSDKAIERLVREVDFTITQESLKARRDIREAAVRVTMEMAEKLVQDRITDSDRRRLADEYIGEVASTKTNLN